MYIIHRRSYPFLQTWTFGQVFVDPISLVLLRSFNLREYLRAVWAILRVALGLLFAGYLLVRPARYRSVSKFGPAFLRQVLLRVSRQRAYSRAA